MENEINNYGLPEVLRDGLEESEYNHRVKYRNLYIRLIERGLKMTPEELSGYNEKHHILPKCLGGKDDKSNIVILPVRYHIMAHFILTKVFPDHRGVIYAAIRMIDGGKRGARAESIQKNFSSRLVASIREESHYAISGKNHPKYGKPQSEETKRKIAETKVGPKNPMYGKHPSEETLRKKSLAMRGENNPMYGKHLPHTEEFKEMMRGRFVGSKSPSARKVIGPDGTVYGSLGEASKFGNIPYGTLQGWLSGRGSSNHGWTYKEASKIVYKKKRSYENVSRKVISPNGEIYESIKIACKENNIADTTMRYWLSGRTKKNPGWSYYNENNQKSD